MANSFLIFSFQSVYSHTVQHGEVLLQGMTIRTARLPGAGNLLSRAGEDISGLPDWASRYQFF